MKNLFMLINFVIGIVGGVLGIIAISSLFGATHNYLAALVGLSVLAIAGVCLWFCVSSLETPPDQPA